MFTLELSKADLILLIELLDLSRKTIDDGIRDALKVLSIENPSGITYEQRLYWERIARHLNTKFNRALDLKKEALKLLAKEED